MGLLENVRAAMASGTGEDIPVTFDPVTADPVYQVFNDHADEFALHQETLANIQNIEEDLVAMGGVNRSLATECFRVIEDFGSGRIKLNHYTSSPSKTQLRLTLEEIDAKRAGIIAAAIAAVVALIATVGRWIWKKLTGEDSLDDTGSNAGSTDSSSPPPDLREGSQQAEAAVDTIQEQFSDVDEDEKKYTELIKTYGEMLKRNAEALDTNFVKGFIEKQKEYRKQAEEFGNTDDPDRKDEIAKRAKELETEFEEQQTKLREEIHRLLTDSEGLMKSFRDANDCLSFNRALPERLQNKRLIAMLSPQDRDYVNFVAKTEYVTAMSAACSSFPALTQMSEHVLNVAEEAVESFSKLTAGEGNSPNDWTLPQQVKEFIERRNDPAGPCGMLFMGKQMLVHDALAKIREIENTPPGSIPTPTVARVVDSFRVNFVNSNIKSFMSSAPELFKRIDELKEKMVLLSESADRASQAADKQGERFLPQKRAMNDMLTICANYTKDALHLAFVITNYATQYSAFVDRFTTIVRSEMIRPDVIRHIEEMRKKTRHAFLEYKKKSGMSEADFEVYVKKFQEIFTEELTEERRKILQQMDKAQITVTGHRFDPSAIRKRSSLMEHAADFFKNAYGYFLNKHAGGARIED